MYNIYIKVSNRLVGTTIYEGLRQSYEDPVEAFKTFRKMLSIARKNYIVNSRSVGSSDSLLKPTFKSYYFYADEYKSNNRMKLTLKKE